MCVIDYSDINWKAWWTFIFYDYQSLYIDCGILVRNSRFSPQISSSPYFTLHNCTLFNFILLYFIFLPNKYKHAISMNICLFINFCIFMNIRLVMNISIYYFIGTYCGFGMTRAPDLLRDPCPAGFYCSVKTVVPTPCPGGTYSPVTGRSFLSECLWTPKVRVTSDHETSIVMMASKRVFHKNNLCWEWN